MSLLDIAGIILILFVFAIGALFSYVILDGFYTKASDVLDNESLNIVGAGMTNISGLDYAFLFLFVAEFVILLVSCFYLDTHPIFFGVSLIIFIILIPVGALIANAYLAIDDMDVLASAYTQFSLIRTVWQNMPIIQVMFGVLAAVVIYGKRGDRNVGF